MRTDQSQPSETFSCVNDSKCMLVAALVETAEIRVGQKVGQKAGRDVVSVKTASVLHIHARQSWIATKKIVL